MFPFGQMHGTGPCDDDGLKVDNHPADDEPTDPDPANADYDQTHLGFKPLPEGPEEES